MANVYVVIEQEKALVENVRVFKTREAARREAKSSLEENCVCGQCLKRWAEDFGDCVCTPYMISLYERPVREV